MSTKLKLMGVDVASFGNCFADEQDGQGRSPSKTRSRASTRSSLFNPTARACWAASWSATPREYGTLSMLAKSDEPLPMPPSELLLGKRGEAEPPACVDGMPDDAQVCSCNNVSKAQICDAIRDKNLTLGRRGQDVHARPAPAAAAACRW